MLDHLIHIHSSQFKQSIVSNLKEVCKSGDKQHIIFVRFDDVPPMWQKRKDMMIDVVLRNKVCINEGFLLLCTVYEMF